MQELGVSFFAIFALFRSNSISAVGYRPLFQIAFDDLN